MRKIKCTACGHERDFDPSFRAEGCIKCGAPEIFMDASKTTHILMTWQENKTEMLFRADSGICIGQCKEETVIFGDEPNKRRSHVFIDHEHALAWLRGEWALQDLNRDGQVAAAVVNIETRLADPIIVAPQGTVELGQLMGPRKFN